MTSDGVINELGLQYIGEYAPNSSSPHLTELLLPFLLDWKGPGLPDSSLPRGANANRPPNSASSLQIISSISLGALGLALALGVYL